MSKSMQEWAIEAIVQQCEMKGMTRQQAEEALHLCKGEMDPNGTTWSFSEVPRDLRMQGDDQSIMLWWQKKTCSGNTSSWLSQEDIENVLEAFDADSVPLAI